MNIHNSHGWRTIIVHLNHENSSTIYGLCNNSQITNLHQYCISVFSIIFLFPFFPSSSFSLLFRYYAAIVVAKAITIVKIILIVVVVLKSLVFAAMKLGKFREYSHALKTTLYIELWYLACHMNVMQYCRRNISFSLSMFVCACVRMCVWVSEVMCVCVCVCVCVLCVCVCVCVLCVCACWSLGPNCSSIDWLLQLSWASLLVFPIVWILLWSFDCGIVSVLIPCYHE